MSSIMSQSQTNSHKQEVKNKSKLLEDKQKKTKERILDLMKNEN